MSVPLQPHSSSSELFELVEANAGPALALCCPQLGPPSSTNGSTVVEERFQGSINVSYDELLTRARAVRHVLAPLLDRASFNEETPLVLLRMTRTPSLVVGLLSVLACGAAYVPIDPDHPLKHQRLIAMQSHASVALVSVPAESETDDESVVASIIQTRDTEDKLENSDDLGPLIRWIIRVDALGHVVAVDSRPLLPPPSILSSGAPSGLAYVMFTSGSTGLPKGVLVGAAGVKVVLNHFQGMLAFDASDALLAVTTPAFDISVLELLLPLVSGACLVLAPSAATRDGAALATLLRGGTSPAYATITRKHDAGTETAASNPVDTKGSIPRITAMQATPATWRMVLHAGWAGDGAVRVLCGGEAFPSALRPLASTCRSVHNLYGPTEATIWCTSHLVTTTSETLTSFGTRGVPIGLPLGYIGCKCAVVDLASGSHEVEAGEEGELWVSGPAIAVGYFGDKFAALTKERFVIRALSQDTMRWYRTGDVVVKSSDSALYFVRRVDDEQVKIAGHRVEVGEVEAALRSTQLKPPLAAFQVRDVAVVPTSSMIQSNTSANDESGFLTLAAFVVFDVVDSDEMESAGNEKLDVRALSLALESELLLGLPAFMVPRKWTLYLSCDFDGSSSRSVSRKDFRIGTLPLNTNGKVDRKFLIGSLREKTSANTPFCTTVGSSSKTPASFSDLLYVVKTAVSATLGYEYADNEIDEIFPSDFNLETAGIASIGVVLFCSNLSSLLGGVDIPSTVPMTCPRIEDLARYLHEDRGISLTAPPSPSSKASRYEEKNGRKKQCKKIAPSFDPGLEACREGRLSDVLELIASGWDVETVDRFGSPGLHWAASGGFLDVCKALIEVGGADPMKRDKKSGRSAIHWAARQGHLEVVKWLVEEREFIADDLTKDGTSTLHLAYWGGHHATVGEYLLAQGASLHRLNSWNCNAAHFAALAGNLSSLQWLSEKGLDIKNVNSQGHNALHKAAYGGHRDICEWLQDGPLRVDPEASLEDVRGQTPAALAIKGGFPELGKWLTRHRNSTPTRTLEGDAFS